MDIPVVVDSCIFHCGLVIVVVATPPRAIGLAPREAVWEPVALVAACRRSIANTATVTVSRPAPLPGQVGAACSTDPFDIALGAAF